jgi:hypothetical protein
MITQIKHWLQKLFSWWRWWEKPVPADAPVESHPGRGIGTDPMMRSSLDGALPQQGVAPQMGSQGEPRCSTMENWREPDPQIHPYSPVPDENWGHELPFSPPPSQIEPGRENTITPAAGEKAFPAIPPVPLPAPVSSASAKPKSEPQVEQHLEFLHYLVLRGIVNEGFPEGQVPEQYRKSRK